MTRLERHVHRAREIHDRLSGRPPGELTPLQRYICEASGVIVYLADVVDDLEDVSNLDPDPEDESWHGTDE